MRKKNLRPLGRPNGRPGMVYSTALSSRMHARYEADDMQHQCDGSYNGECISKRITHSYTRGTHVVTSLLGPHIGVFIAVTLSMLCYRLCGKLVKRADPTTTSTVFCQSINCHIAELTLPLGRRFGLGIRSGTESSKESVSVTAVSTKTRCPKAGGSLSRC